MNESVKEWMKGRESHNLEIPKDWMLKLVYDHQTRLSLMSEIIVFLVATFSNFQHTEMYSNQSQYSILGKTQSWWEQLLGLMWNKMKWNEPQISLYTPTFPGWEQSSCLGVLSQFQSCQRGHARARCGSLWEYYFLTFLLTLHLFPLLAT